MPSRSSSLSLSLSLLSLSGVLFVPCPGRAAESEARPYPSCQREPTSSDVSAAKGAFEAGEVSFQEADYERAILYWEDAFRRDCTAVKLLTNLARAYELAGQKAHAVQALRSFLERRPESPERASIEKRIGVLQRQLDEERARASATPSTTQIPPPSAVEDPSPGASKPQWPIYVTAGGALLLAVGVPLWVDGQSKVDYYKALCPSDGGDPPSNVCPPTAEHGAAENQRFATDAVQQRNFGVVASVTGGSVALAGAILWYVLWERDEPSTTALRPVVAPGYSGFEWSGSF